MTRPFATLLWALATCMALAAGQRAPQFHASTTFVEVDVLVQDKTGRFVDGLTGADFSVFDEGRPQLVESFYVVRRGATLSGRHTAPGDGDSTPIVSLQRSIVLYFDTNHMRFVARRRAQTAVEEFLSETFLPGDIGGVIFGGVMANNRLTTSREELLNAVRGIKTTETDRTGIPTTADLAPLNDPSGGMSSASSLKAAEASAAIDELLARADTAEDFDASGRTDQLTLNSLLAVVKGLARIPGRKNLVFLSNGFVLRGLNPGDLPGSEWPIVKAIVLEAAKSFVRIYSIDARGLDQTSGAIISASRPSTVGEIKKKAPDPTPEDLLTQLAVDTGGLFVQRQNNFKKALDQVGSDSASYYVLGFRPTLVEKGAKFHLLKVRVNRRGLSVRSRLGYVAQ